MTYTPQILNIVKYIGALYLIYIGYKTFTQKTSFRLCYFNRYRYFSSNKVRLFYQCPEPKTTLFVISTYTQIVSLTTPKTILLAYGFFMSFAHFVWFSLVAVCFHPCY
jgi:threonine/homoserine/homoserine lactone efflux protein